MSDAGLSMPEALVSTARNGRPIHTHDRLCHSTIEGARLHREHGDSTCVECGCCWGCVSDCCAEFTCPNADCGCSAKPAPTYVLPAREALTAALIGGAR